MAPDNLEEFFPFEAEECGWSTAAADAAWGRDPKLLKVLHLNPTAEQAVALLDATSYNHNVELFRQLLQVIPREKLNHSKRDSCVALERLVGSRPAENIFTRIPNEQANVEKLQSIELLLDAGARWNPPEEELKSDRRSLLKHDGKHIVQVIRLLLYTPKAADASRVLELCRSQSVIGKIALVDAALVTELKQLQRQNRVNTGIHKNPDTVIGAQAPDA